MRKWILFALCALITLSICGCAAQEASPTESTETTMAAPTLTTAAIIEKQLGDLLTAEEISNAIGQTMNTPVVSNQG
ncbi:MAG: hypothetical protein IJU16_03510, partial [Clostridia bacterium]|nr:hypothetical protein [Clostridia bacterium]